MERFYGRATRLRISYGDLFTISAKLAFPLIKKRYLDKGGKNAKPETVQSAGKERA